MNPFRFIKEWLIADAKSVLSVEPSPVKPPPIPYQDERWCKRGMSFSDVIRESETRIIELQHVVKLLQFEVDRLSKRVDELEGLAMERMVEEAFGTSDDITGQFPAPMPWKPEDVIEEFHLSKSGDNNGAYQPQGMYN